MFDVPVTTASVDLLVVIGFAVLSSTVVELSVGFVLRVSSIVETVVAVKFDSTVDDVVWFTVLVCLAVLDINDGSPGVDVTYFTVVESKTCLVDTVELVESDVVLVTMLGAVVVFATDKRNLTESVLVKTIKQLII